MDFAPRISDYAKVFTKRCVNYISSSMFSGCSFPATLLLKNTKFDPIHVNQVWESVQTKQSMYCLDGDPERVPVSPIERRKVIARFLEPIPIF